MNIKITCGKTIIEYDDVTERSMPMIIDHNTGTRTGEPYRDEFMRNMQTLCNKVSAMERQRMDADYE